jgi:large subunit ribosomal protein L5
MPPRLKERYQKEVSGALKEQYQYGNVMQIPRITKINVNIGLGEALTDANALDKAADEVTAITGQKPVITRAKRSIANFRLREGNPIGVATTLRGDRMWEFLDRLVSAALPRIRDFQGLNPNAFDGRGNYSLGLREQLIFPEIEYDRVDKVRGMQVTIVTTAKTDEEGRKLNGIKGHCPAGSAPPGAQRQVRREASGAQGRASPLLGEPPGSHADPGGADEAAAELQPNADPQPRLRHRAAESVHPQVRPLPHHVPRACPQGHAAGSYEIQLVSAKANC